MARDAQVANSDRVDVRAMDREDVEAVAEIFRESPGAASWSAQTLADSLSAGARGWVAQQDAKIATAKIAEAEIAAARVVGTRIVGALIGRVAADEFEILNLAVSPPHRRRGIAGALLDRTLHFASSAGCTTVHLEVRKSNASAIALYRGRGFLESGKRKQYYQNPTEDALLLARSISKTIGKK